MGDNRSKSNVASSMPLRAVATCDQLAGLIGPTLMTATQNPHGYRERVCLKLT
jgi:hypothetical protein